MKLTKEDCEQQWRQQFLRHVRMAQNLEEAGEETWSKRHRQWANTYLTYIRDSDKIFDRIISLDPPTDQVILSESTMPQSEG